MRETTDVKQDGFCHHQWIAEVGLGSRGKWHDGTNTAIDEVASAATPSSCLR
jgi:hypothetical protein